MLFSLGLTQRYKKANKPNNQPVLRSITPLQVLSSSLEKQGRHTDASRVLKKLISVKPMILGNL